MGRDRFGQSSGRAAQTVGVSPNGPGLRWPPAVPPHPALPHKRHGDTGHSQADAASLSQLPPAARFVSVPYKCPGDLGLDFLKHGGKQLKASRLYSCLGFF